MAGINIQSTQIGANSGGGGLVDPRSRAALIAAYPANFSGASIITINGRVKFFGDPNSGLEPVTLGDGTVFYLNSEFPIQTDIITSGTSWSRATVSGATSIKVWVVGGGGSGGAASTDSGREKVASGGAAGGIAVRTYSYSTVTSATIAIGSGGIQPTTVSGSGAYRAGYSGGTTSFTPNSGTAISATGGERGYGSRLGKSNNGDNGATATYGWGTCDSSVGGTGSGGDNNYTGGGSAGWNIGGDGSGATGGGSPNFGLGSDTGGFDGFTITGAGQQYGAASPIPNLPDGITSASNWNSAWTFRGSAGNEHSSGTSVQPSNATLYGAGGGGMAQESGSARTSGAGSQGCIIVQYI